MGNIVKTDRTRAIVFDGLAPTTFGGLLAALLLGLSSLCSVIANGPWSVSVVLGLLTVALAFIAGVRFGRDGSYTSARLKADASKRPAPE